MITQTDAIRIGVTILNAGHREIIILPESQEYKNRIPGIRGAMFAALNDFYYDVLTNKVRSQFGYSLERFTAVCLEQSNWEY